VDVPSKESGGGPHPSSGAMVGQRYVVAFDGGGAGMVITDGRGVPLQLGGGGQ
jgi:hypothetical protein